MVHSTERLYENVGMSGPSSLSFNTGENSDMHPDLVVPLLKKYSQQFHSQQ